MAQQSKPSANLPTISRITLTQLIAALQALNVDVISPAQELAGKLNVFIFKCVLTPARRRGGSSQWWPRQLPKARP